MVPGTWINYLNLNGVGNFLKHDRLQMGFDGTVKMYQSSAQPMLKLDGVDFLLQNDAASPVHGILLDGTRPLTWKRYLDLVDGTLVIKDDQATPVTRVQVGKAGAGAQDYGLQVFDQNAATVMDFTGAKRIIAVPVQASVDSGTSLTIDLSTGLTQQVRLTGTATITLNNPVNGSRYRLWFQQDTVGSRPFPTIKGPTGDEIVMFENDTPPTLSSEPGAFDLFEFEYRTDSTKRFTCMPLQTNVLLPTPKVISVTSTSFNTAGTGHNVNMPATVEANELLLMFIAFSGTSSKTTPSGWTQVTGTGPLVVYAKVAVGNEDGTVVNVLSSLSETAGAHVYRITRWRGDISGVTGSSTSGAPAGSGDHPAVTPSWAVDRSLWFIAVGISALNTISDAGGYGSFQQTDGSNGVGADARCRSGRRIRYAVTEDPGSSSWLGTPNWRVATIAVRPPA